MRALCQHDEAAEYCRCFCKAIENRCNFIPTVYFDLVNGHDGRTKGLYDCDFEHGQRESVIAQSLLTEKCCVIRDVNVFLVFFLVRSPR